MVIFSFNVIYLVQVNYSQMALVTFILLLGVSLAACPNGCSSHGTCNIDGSCTCFRQTGLALNGAYFDDFSWTGPDCSLSMIYMINHNYRNMPKGFFFRSLRKY